MPTGNSTAVRFVLDGEIVNVPDCPPTLTVLDYLRDHRCRTGTKEGCAEGDCGACTVVLGELTRERDSINYRAINSCIRFLPTIDGKELVTVESLAHPQAGLHPVQQAMVDEHASQCGFCTPGFVMSLFALYLDDPQPTRASIVDALAGNLCRCTGYRPIIAAGARMGTYPTPERWSRDEVKSPARVRVLQEIARDDGQALRSPGFSAPRTEDELAAMFAAAPDSLLLAGGTDIGLRVTQQLRELPPLIYIGEISRLRETRRDDGKLWIGAGVTLNDAWPALTEIHPELLEQARRFASPPICNSATLGGNVANGSPIGDSMPALIALGAQVELRHGSQVRRLPLERLYLGYQRKALARGEFVVGIEIPTQRPTYFASYKVAKRFDQDISAVSAAFAITTQQDRIVDARVAFGGMAVTPSRATQAEAALVDHSWSAETIATAIAALATDFKPLSDLRASDRYRLTVAGNLLKRFYLQHAPASGPSRTVDALLAVGE